MEKLKNRISNLIFEFGHSKTLTKHAYTLDYENGIYRQKELVRVIKDAVIHFALTPEEIEDLKKTDDFGEMERKAWARISKANKNTKGDYGELLLFLILLVFYPTKKFVSKVRLRSSKKDQIKGFDCAHFTVENGQVYLWLGEAKFHKSFSTGCPDAIKSINEHCEFNYMSDEISILASNLELNKSFPHYKLLENVLSGGVSIDKINIRIPVLLTYDSQIINRHSDISDSLFIEEMKKELSRRYVKIDGHKLNIKKNIEVIFIILPMESVGEIKDYLETLEEAMLL